MHARDRGVDRDDPVDFPSGVGLLLHLGEQLLPGAVPGPPVEPLVDRVPLPEPFRNVTPRRTGPVLPRHPLDSEPVIRPRPRPTGHRRHQRLHHGPHLVRDLLSRHRSRLTHRGAEPLDQHALAPAAGEWSPARAQALSRAPWRAVEIAAITAGVSWASVVSMREIVGVEATSPNTPGSHRSKSVSRATSPPTARVIARSSTTFAA